MSTSTPPEPLLRGPLRTLTVGSVALVSLAAFEAVAVATAMPTVAVALDGLSAYALAFGLPLATSVLGMVVAGVWSDARGPAPAMRTGVALFVVALLVAGLAPTMAVFSIGRAAQGLGAGMFSVALYVVVGHVVPQAQRPRIFAAFAAAWVLPAVLGPPIAGFLVERADWRWVFLLAAGLAVPAAALVEPALRGLGTTGTFRPGRVVWAAGAAVGAGALHQAAQLPVLPGVLLGVGATAVLAVTLPRLLPRGTLRGRRGMPAVIALRGLVAAAFLSAEAFLPLLLSRERGLSPTLAGLVLTAAALSWAAGSWIQGRDRAPSRTVLLRIGTATIALGVLAAGLTVLPAVPLAVAVLGWTAAGLGIGMVYPTLSVLVLELSPPTEQGANSSALQIAEAVFTTVALAVSGALFAGLVDAGAVAYAAGFAVAVLAGLLGMLVAGRVAPGHTA